MARIVVGVDAEFLAGSGCCGGDREGVSFLSGWALHAKQGFVEFQVDFAIRESLFH